MILVVPAIVALVGCVRSDPDPGSDTVEGGTTVPPTRTRYWEAEGDFVSFSVSGNGFGVCALDEKGALTCWDSKGDCTTPAFEDNLRQVVHGYFDICALYDDRQIHCADIEGEPSRFSPPFGEFDVIAVSFAICGGNEWGIACNEGFGFCGAEQPKLTDVRGLVISGGNLGYACALDVDGWVTCWGDYPGSGCNWVDFTCECDEEPKPLILGPFARFTSSFCGLGFDGSLSCFDAPSGTYTFLGESYHHAVAVAADGTLAYWRTDYVDPSALETPDRQFVQAHAGWDMTCGIDVDGNLLCWGDEASDIQPCK